MRSRKNKPLTIWMVSLIFFLFLFFLVKRPVAHAQSTQPIQLAATNANCQATDLVLLVDQSDSMTDANDPNGNRFNAAETVIDFLGNHVIWFCRGQNIQHRVAMIGFGDRIGTPDTKTYFDDQIVPPVNDLIEWRKDREDIHTQIRRAEEDRLGATDHKSALLAAREILEQWANSPLPGSPRKSTIILITDGEPCLIERGCGDGYYNIVQDMGEIEELTNATGEMFPWRGENNAQSVTISLILLSKRIGSFQALFINDWESITQSHNGDVFQANQSNTNLNTIVTDIMTPIIGSGMQQIECNQEFWITPYTNNLFVLYAFSLAENLNPDDPSNKAIITIDTGEEIIEVQNGRSRSILMSIKDYAAEGRNEFYTFSPPIPGKYRVSFPGQEDCRASLDVRVETQPISYKVVAPLPSASYPAITPPNPHVAEKFRIDVFGDDQQTQPIQEIPGYPLTITATSWSENKNHQQTLGFINLGNGVYESTQVIETPVEGDYSWTVQAKADNPNPDGEPILVFETEGSFFATKVQLLGFQIISPPNADVRLLNTLQGPQQIPQPIPVTITFLVDGQPQSPTRVLTTTQDIFIASLKQGNTLYQQLSMTLKAGSTNEFEVEFDNSRNGSILTPGDYTIEVTANWQQAGYNLLVYAPEVTQSVVEITQQVLIPLQITIYSPTDITLHQTTPLESLMGVLRPFDFYAEITHALTGETIPLEQVLQNPDDPIQATLVPPSGQKMELSLLPLEGQKWSITSVGSDIPDSGQYEIQIATTDIDLFQNRAGWAGNESKVTFLRVDNSQSSPTRWRIEMGVFAVVAVLLALGSLYLWTGGPTGSISIISRTGVASSEVAAGPWRLRRRPRTNRIKNKWLEEQDIKLLKVRKVSPSDPDNKRAVSIEAISKTGASVFVSVIDAKQEEPFVEGDIRYE